MVLDPDTQDRAERAAAWTRTQRRRLDRLVYVGDRLIWDTLTADDRRALLFEWSCLANAFLHHIGRPRLEDLTVITPPEGVDL